MATLTNTKIKDTYDGLLKTTNNEAIASSGVTLIEDGLGNASALSVGRSGNGVSVSGLLDVTGEVQGTSLDINGAADISGNLAVDTNTLYVDASNNRVGIGTSSPSTKLHLNDSTDSDMSIRLQNSPSILYVGVDNTTGSRFIGSSGSAAYIGTTTSSPIQFATANEVRATIDSSGNVGINCSPSYKLDTQGVIRANTVGLADGMIIYGNDNNNVKLKLTNVGTGGEEWQVQVGQQGASNSDFAIRCNTTSQNVLLAGSNGNVVIPSGNVGIGTSPIVPLTLKGEFRIQDTTATTGTKIGYDNASSLNFQLYNYQNGNIEFATNGTERMRITSGGFLKASDTGTYVGSGISYHELYNSTGGNQILQATSSASINPYGISVSFTGASPDNNSQWFIRAEDSTTARFYVYSDGDVWTSDAGTLTSDETLKNTITDATPKLDDVMNLKVRNYYWNEDYHPNKTDKKLIGFVAQEFEEVFPALVSEHKIKEEEIAEDGSVIQEAVYKKGIKEGKLIPILVKAMQEQQEIINDLKARIETLENK